MIANKQPKWEVLAPLRETIKGIRYYFSTPIKNPGVLNSILILSASALVIVFLRWMLNDLNQGSQNILISATAGLSILTIVISVRYIYKINAEVSRAYVLGWLIKTVLVIAIICFAHPILSQWTILFLPAAVADRLLLPIWIFLVPVIAVSVLFWRTISWKASWKAFLSGVIGGTLLLYIWTPLAYVYVYNRYVPNINFHVDGLPELAQWALAIGTGILFLSGFVSLQQGRPSNRGQAITFAGITGLTISGLLFTLPGSLLASIASQNSLYNVAFTRVGYDETNWVGAIVNSTLYIFPWVYGVQLACIAIGIILLFIGLFWPIRREFSISNVVRNFSGLSPVLFSFSFLALLLSIVWIPTLATKIENSVELYGSTHWWSTVWIVPIALALPVLLGTTILLQVFAQIPSRTPTFRNAMFLRDVGSSLFGGALAIFVLKDVVPWMVLLLGGIGVELFFQARRLVPDTGGTESLDEPQESWGERVAGSAPIAILMLQPIAVIVFTLALMPIVAIATLRDVNGPPAGREWLVQLTDSATFTIPVFSWLLNTVLLILLLCVMNALNWVRPRPVWEMTESAILWVKNRLTIRERRVSWFYFILIYIGLVIFFLIALDSSIPSLIFIGLLVLVILVNSQQDAFKRAGMLPYLGAGIVILLEIVLLAYPSTATLLTTDIIRLLWPALAILYGALLSADFSFRKSLSRIFFLLAVGIIATLMINLAEPVAILENGVARFSAGRWINDGSPDSFLAADRNYSLFPDSTGKLWFVGYFGPDAILEDGAWSKLRFYPFSSDFTSLDRTGRLSRLEHTGLFLEQGENYWFMNESQIYMLVPTANGFVSNTPRRAESESPGNTSVLNPCGTGYICPDLQRSRITSAIVDHASNIWVGTAEAGLIRFLPNRPPDNAVWDVFTAENSGLASNSVVGLLADDQDRLWVLNQFGVSVLSPDGQWTSYNFNDTGLGGIMLTLYQDQEGQIWVGSTTGLASWSNGTWYISREISSSVYAFHEDRSGRLWALTSAGAYTYVDGSWSFIMDIPRDPRWQNPFRISPLYNLEPTGTGVTTMAEDKDSILWFGGPHGLSKYDPRTQQPDYFYPSNSGLPSEHVQSLFVDNDNRLWVSTYTLHQAHRSEVPVIGLAILFVALVLGNSYLQYQNSTQYRASQISRRIAEQPQSLLKEIYRSFQEAESGQVLESLTKHMKPHQGFHVLVQAYSQIYRLGLDTPRDKASYISRALSDNPALPEDKELVALHSYFVRALSVLTVNDISRLPLQVLRAQNGNRITLTDDKSTPYDLASLVDIRLADALEMIGKSSVLLRKYLQIDNAQDKLAFIADSLGAVERAKRDADSVSGPEQYFVHEICELWLGIISRELDMLSGHADLRVEFRTRQVRRSDEVTLVLRVGNVGSAIANQVQISLLPNAGIHLDPKDTRLLEYIGAGSSETVEFSIQTPAAGDVRVAGEITWSDRIEDKNHLAFADIVRFYESTGRFERIPNPYVVGHPVKSASLFQGREDIFDFISHNIHGTTQSRTLVLYGQRRTGKTSILYQLLNGRLGKDHFPVLVDVQELAPGIHGMKDLLLELALHMERALKKAGLKPEKVDEAAFAASPTRTFGRFLDSLEERLVGRKIVFMFDEFELLEERILQGKLEPESLGYLRSLIQHRDNLAFIFTGTHKLEQMSKDYWSIFFNIALHQQISFMKDDDATHLIREPVKGMLSIDDLVVDKILSLTHGHPYFIQLLCWALVNYCNKKEKNYATLSDLNDVLKEIVSTGDAYFAYIWSQVSADEKIILSAVAERLAPGRNSISLDEIFQTIENAGVQTINKTIALRLLDGLTDQEIVSSSGHGGLLYSYRVGLIGEWVKSSKPLRYLVEREL